MLDRQYVFCIPRGGFNDVLSQIEKAWRYAESYERILVVDARHSGLTDSLSRYFSTEVKGVFLHPGEALLRHFDSLEVSPSFLRGRVSRHSGRYEGHYVFKDVDTGLPLSFDMSRAYRKALLVHHACGGNELGFDCLRRLTLLPEVATEIFRSLVPLGMDYDAVHIRNTDIGTDYLAFFRQIFPKVRGQKLLICSDDLACREAAKNFFVESKVLTVTDIPDTCGNALHYYAEQNTFAKNLAMLTDLFALARARRLFVAQITAGCKKGEMSGFSWLAHKLQAHQEIVDGIFASLSENPPFCQNPPSPVSTPDEQS
jgi:hypothetical protein